MAYMAAMARYDIVTANSDITRCYVHFADRRHRYPIEKTHGMLPVHDAYTRD